MLDGHGDDLHLYTGHIEYNFSSNVYHRGCPPQLTEVLKKSLTIIQNYPSPAAKELNLLAAEKFDLLPEHFIFTNGATEAFYLIAQSFHGQSATIVGPTFSEYEDACRVNQISSIFITQEKLTEDLNTDLVFICNPNNPDGKTLSVDNIHQLLQKNPKTVFVIDEAYIEFSTTAQSVISLLSTSHNLIVVRSLTKTFCIPGLRLGYLISNPDRVNQLLSFKMPWSVNSLAAHAGQFIFQNYASLLFDINHLIKDTIQFQNNINKIDWLEVIPSSATFFLVLLKHGKASELKSYLIKEHQILIRDATNFTGLNGEYIRLSTQNDIANQALIKSLNEWN